jgi:hypothetical protein
MTGGSLRRGDAQESQNESGFVHVEEMNELYNYCFNKTSVIGFAEAFPCRHIEEEISGPLKVLEGDLFLPHLATFSL